MKQEVGVSKEARLLLKRLKNCRAFFLGGRANSNRGAATRVLALLLTLFLWASASTNAWCATYRTSNFIVNADSEDFARQAGEVAERYRRDLAIWWFGEELPTWSNPCVLTIKTGPTLGAAGETVFTVSNGEVFKWKMTAQGTEERVLDSVLPHEITHSVLASFLRAQPPRWIDEGMATLTESNVERTNYRLRLADFLHSRRGIAFNDMVAMKEYPKDVQPFYSQVFSVCEYLILIGGPRRLAEFAKEGSRTNDWNAALRRYYEGRTLGDLQLEWIAWVGEWDAANRPAQLPATPKLRDFEEWRREEMLASRGNAPRQTWDLEPTARAQNAEPAESPSKWKTTLGDVFDGVRSWGRGAENAQSGNALTIRGREERIETTSADVRSDRSRDFGTVREVAPNWPNTQEALGASTKQNVITTQNTKMQQRAQAAQNEGIMTAAPNVGERRAPIWIPRANGLAASNEAKTNRTGVLTSGAGSASRSTVL